MKNQTLKIVLSLFLISTLISALLLFLFSPFSKYKFKLAYVENNEGRTVRLFHDFDHDGYSEIVRITNNLDEKHFLLNFEPYQQDFSSRKVRDQFDFSEPVEHPDWFVYYDYTKDNNDDLFLFTVANDSLFFYGIDHGSGRWLFKRQFLATVVKPNPHHCWDVFFQAEITDLDNDGLDEMIFMVRSGKSHFPRGIYIYDLQKKHIRHKWESGAAFQRFRITDLDEDGEKEIICQTQAAGNITQKMKYKDDTCWLFLFDKHLNLLKKPISFGAYPSNAWFSIYKQDEQNRLMLVFDNSGTNVEDDAIFLFDSGLDRLKKRPFKYDLNFSHLVYDNNQKPLFYLSTKGSHLLALNSELESIKEKPFDFTNIQFIKLIDMTQDGVPEIVARSGSGIHILNLDLELLASQEGTPIGLIQFRQNGSWGNINIARNGSEQFNLYSFEENPLYSLWPLFFVGSISAIFILLLLLFNLFKFIYIYSQYFIFSLKRSSNAILILNEKGRIIFLNSRVQQFLNLQSQLKKGMHYSSALAERREVVDTIINRLSDFRFQQKTDNEDNSVTIIDKQFQFKGEISITPLASKHFIFAWLIIIKDFTGPVQSDRIKTWSRSVQKMAHEIKQPLSSVALNLKALQKRLEKENLQTREEINDDISMMKSELERVRQMTTNFLKFVNLDTPKKQLLNIEQLLASSMERFNTILDDNLELQIMTEHSDISVYADPRQLEIVFHILVENAIDALKGKGAISIKTNMAQNLNNSFKYYLQIEISDNGPGVPENIKEQLFEPFFTTKIDGTGIGLAMAKKIMEDHGGEISLYSKEGLGATFTMMLPVGDN